jgi:hypothetical protein
VLTFFISTGRCGTQWLARTLETHYADLAVVRHDPIGARYRPASMFRQWDRAAEVEEIPDAVAELAMMRGLDRDYIDTGWASYAALPYFIARFPGAVRLVHLVRHPVPTAASLVSLDVYAPSRRRDEWTEMAFIGPTTPGVRQPEYAAQWDSMTTFEKCLFWWTEINLYAEDVGARFPDVPMMRLRSEDMFAAGGEGMARLLTFLGLPSRPGVSEATATRFDRWRFGLDEDVDWRQAASHPLLLKLMDKYGYSMEGVEDVAQRDLPRAEAKPWHVG